MKENPFSGSKREPTESEMRYQDEHIKEWPFTSIADVRAEFESQTGHLGGIVVYSEMSVIGMGAILQGVVERFAYGHEGDKRWIIANAVVREATNRFSLKFFGSEKTFDSAGNHWGSIDIAREHAARLSRKFLGENCPIIHNHQIIENWRDGKCLVPPKDPSEIERVRAIEQKILEHAPVLKGIRVGGSPAFIDMTLARNYARKESSKKRRPIVIKKDGEIVETWFDGAKKT